MSTAPLVTRLTQLFSRQVAFYDELLGEQGEFQAKLSQDDLTAMMAVEKHRADEMSAMQREQALLMREWAQATPTEDEKETVRKAMAEAMARAEDLMKYYEHAIAEVERRKIDIAQQQGDLHRGRNVLNKYRPTQGGDPDTLDKQA